MNTRYIKYLLFIFLCAGFISCEDVVTVDLDTAAPRLVVDASINWIKGTNGSRQKIVLTTTAPYYSNGVPAVSGATVYIVNGVGTQFNFTEEEPGSGEYFCNDFFPELNQTYTLTVVNDGQVYTATESLYPTPDIAYTTQDGEGGFLNEDYEVRFYYQDNPTQDNFYMHRFDSDVMPYPDYDVIDDEFFQGNMMFGIFSDEDLGPGKEIGIQLYGISERYYNYMNKLINIAEGGSGGGPFQTPPVTVRGNLVNQTDSNNFALGYFRLGEVARLNYTVE